MTIGSVHRRSGQPTSVLVLGGTRFVGRAIVNGLLPHADVSVLNRGTRALWDERIRQVRADRGDPARLRSVGFEAYDMIVDVSGTEPAHVANVLQALPTGVRYVYVSSASVYNREYADPPFGEDDRADGDAIWDGYGRAKAACERLLRAAVDDLTILRPPYVYGPHNTEPRERHLWDLMRAGEPIRVPGHGRTPIQFCHADVLGRIVAARCRDAIPAGVYNVGEPRFYTFAEFLAVLGDVAGVRPWVVPELDRSIPARGYFPFRDAELTLDVSKLTATGAVDDIDLRTGLTTTYAWHRHHDRSTD